MRVLMVHSFHHRRGGDSTYVHGLSRLLRAQGHEVIPLAMRHPLNDPSVWEGWFVPQVDFHSRSKRMVLRSLLRSIHNPEAARATRELIRRHRPDVVHLHHVHHHLTPSVIGPAERARIPIVWTVHDYELVCPQGLLFDGTAPCTACAGHRYHNAVRKRCKHQSLGASLFAAVESTAHALTGVIRRVDRFLCPSRFLAGKLVELGAPADRVLHCANFVGTPDAPGDDPGAGWLFAGRLTREKGVPTLLAAADLVEGELTVCGDGPLRSTVERAAIRGRLGFQGQLSASQLDRQLSRAGVVVVPSVWWENFPYAVTEAQARGRAVVASSVGGIPEQIRDGVDGVLVPPGDPEALADAVQRLLADPKRRRELGASAQRRVRSLLDPQRHVHQVLHHYRAVLR